MRCIHKSILAVLITTAASISFLLASPHSNSPYHSLYLSNLKSSNFSIADHLYILTQRPHIAASYANSLAADYVSSTFSSYGFKSHIVSYNVSLSYPVHRSLTLVPLPPDAPTEFQLSQEVYEGDPYADVAKEAVPTFHAYAKSGNVSGLVVYVNYGRVEDYETLKGMGVNISGTVALAKYGKIYRGDIVNNAYDAGAQGVVIYTDTNDFGGGDGGNWFPDDKWMPPSGVQIGSVYTGVGDPTTPGWASVDECERLSDEEVRKDGGLAKIPSLPVSARDAEPILKSIGGQVANDDWQGGAGSQIYRIGPGPGILNLSYIGKEALASIQNVFGVIEGAEEPDRFIILGNHRDAWTFGAADPNSGTAALLEVARRLGKLQKRGWRPRRTIILCNWDAEEYGLIGSTEWVEENREMLASGAVAYLNVDVAVCGAGFQPTATPQLDNIIQHAAQKVQDPDNPSQTVYDAWAGSTSNGIIGRLGGGGSDFEAFVQHVGIPAANLQFGTGYPVYHSLYDDFVWMKKFGDPMFQRHVAGDCNFLFSSHRLYLYIH
ncbi:hypothetical protein QQ045_026204 [Rhodiola kirilowii]